jgi:hypothetical protein
MGFSRSISRTAAMLLLMAASLAHAAGDLSRQEPIEITIELGKPGQHAFVPNKPLAGPPICAAASSARTARATPTTA